MRDVFRVYLGRLDLMLTEDGPHYPNWDQDSTAIEGDQWQRTGVRSDGASFTVDTFARYFVHDPIHHLWDVRTA